MKCSVPVVLRTDPSGQTRLAQYMLKSKPFHHVSATTILILVVLIPVPVPVMIEICLNLQELRVNSSCTLFGSRAWHLQATPRSTSWTR